ncbi:unnamed protein product [Mesocestoides corti]|uniref:Uncharacterized protein n=2 Tax=Mesocestoides corti TaxID=53468 RepID=A0A0R3U910_MESCO|nr:unnamed protein product [Mesocestoides corti]
MPTGANVRRPRGQNPVFFVTKRPLAGCDGLASVSDVAADSNVCQPLVGVGGGAPPPDAHAGASVLLPSGVLTTASDPCRSEGHHGTTSVPLSQHDPGSCPHELEDRDATDQPGRVNCESQPATSVPPAMVASSTSVQTSSSDPSRAHNSQTQPPPLHDQAFVEMLDVGSLAPENATCAFCDRHDYLHRLDLPNYLTSPCYHCRESLAREAKISPEDLFDLHLQHNVPWPAYLQARFNIPPDGRALDDLIAYDCRWRGREPCTCLGDSAPMPPCVEFPWLYEHTTTTAASAPHSPPPPPPPPPRTSLEPEAADPASPTPTPTAEAKHGDADVAVAPPHPMPPEMTASRTHQHAPSAALPCASRHGRGTLGPPQFCNPIGCSKDAGHQPISIEHRHLVAQKSMSEQPAPVSEAQQL